MQFLPSCLSGLLMDLSTVQRPDGHMVEALMQCSRSLDPELSSTLGRLAKGFGVSSSRVQGRRFAASAQLALELLVLLELDGVLAHTYADGIVLVCRRLCAALIGTPTPAPPLVKGAMHVAVL